MIVVIDYGVGNVGSIISIINKIGFEVIQSCDPQVISKAHKLILPGVGAYDKAMMELNNRNLLSVLHREVIVNKKSILGICLGAQILGKSSEEGTLSGLGWIDMEVKKFNHLSLRVPHMGWNYVKPSRPSPLFDLSPGEENKFYFVHSYYMECKSEEDVIGQTHYGYDFASVVNKENIYGVQFHPEKSHKYGFNLLQSFINA